MESKKEHITAQGEETAHQDDHYAKDIFGFEDPHSPLRASFPSERSKLNERDHREKLKARAKRNKEGKKKVQTKNAFPLSPSRPWSFGHTNTTIEPDLEEIPEVIEEIPTQSAGLTITATTREEHTIVESLPRETILTNGTERREFKQHQETDTRWEDRKYGDYWVYSYEGGWYLGMTGKEEPEQEPSLEHIWMRDMTATDHSITKGRKAKDPRQLVFATTWRKRRTGRTVQGTVGEPEHCKETGINEIWNEVHQNELLGRVSLSGTGNLILNSSAFVDQLGLPFGHL